MCQKRMAMLAAATEGGAKEDKAITLTVHPSDTLPSTKSHVPNCQNLCKQHHHVFKCITLGEHYSLKLPHWKTGPLPTTSYCD